MSVITEKTLLEDIKINTTSLVGSATSTYGLITLDTDPKLIISANANRKNCIIQANSTNTVISYLGYDNTVSSTNFVVSLNAGDIYTQEGYLGDFYISNSIVTEKCTFGEV